MGPSLEQPADPAVPMMSASRGSPPSPVGEAGSPVHLQQLLQLLLHHSDILMNQPGMCALLSTSREVQLLICRLCGGGRGMRCSLMQTPCAQVYDSFTAWLGKHGHLITALHITKMHIWGRDTITDRPPSDYEYGIMSALQTSAAAAPAGLQLHHLSCSSATTAGLKMLVDLTYNTLTSLELGLQPERAACSARAGSSSVSRLGDVLTAVKGLRDLDISTALTIERGSRRCDAATLLQPALLGLGQLTRLSLKNVVLSSGDVLRLLPPGLKLLRLDVSSSRDGPSACWDLAHVTALLDLSDGGPDSTCSTGHMLQECDTLPGQLQQLQLQGLKTAWPLLGLKHLQHLVLHDVSSTPTSELLQLSKLNSLTGVDLNYSFDKVSNDSDSLKTAAQCWAVLPLRQLSLATKFCGHEAVHLSHAAAQQLGRCQCLVELKLDYISVSGKGFAAALKQLPQLQRLSLHDVKLKPQTGCTMSGQVDDQADSMDGLVNSVLQLSSLHHLSLLRLPLREQAAAAAALPAAPRLQHLALEDCGLSSSAALVIALTQTSLQHLSVWGNKMVADDFVAGIAAGQLGQLSHLNLQFTGVKYTAVKDLLCGPRWQMVRVLV